MSMMMTTTMMPERVSMPGQHKSWNEAANSENQAPCFHRHNREKTSFVAEFISRPDELLLVSPRFDGWPLTDLHGTKPWHSIRETHLVALEKHRSFQSEWLVDERLFLPLPEVLLLVVDVASGNTMTQQRLSFSVIEQRWRQ